MTTIVSDKRTRVNSIPFQGKWFSTTAGAGSFFEDGVGDGDIYDLTTSGSAAKVRISKPLNGQLIEARLTMFATSPPTGTCSLRIYIGKFDSDGVTAATMTEAEIAASWKKLSGRDAAISYSTSSQILIDGLNLMKDMPQRGDTNFNEDAFIIGIDLQCSASGFEMTEFKIDCSAQVAEVLS